MSRSLGDFAAGHEHQRSVSPQEDPAPRLRVCVRVLNHETSTVFVKVAYEGAVTVTRDDDGRHESHLSWAGAPTSRCSPRRRCGSTSPPPWPPACACMREPDPQLSGDRQGLGGAITTTAGRRYRPPSTWRLERTERESRRQRLTPVATPDEPVHEALRRPQEDQHTTPHSASGFVHRILAAASTSPPSADEFGLTVVPLNLAPVPTQPPPRWRCQELEPPSPNALAAINPTRHAVVAPLAQLVTGGMTDRAIAVSTTIPPGRTATVPVEPLSPRWWYGGSPTLAGGLSAALTALVVLATSDRPGLRSIARTALWEGYRRPASHTVVGGSGGWALFQGRTLLAAHLLAPADLRAPEASPTAESSSMSLRSRELAATGDDIVHVVHRHADLIEVLLVCFTW